MTLVHIQIGDQSLRARWENERAPLTCAALASRLPLRGKLLHARWSGEAMWIPLGDLMLNVPAENAIHEPKPGELLLYPGGKSETEILIPYGTTRFASIAGSLAGNPVLTIVNGHELLVALGALSLWHGAQSKELDHA